jgi:tellurium resistance protein TerZ
MAINLQKGQKISLDKEAGMTLTKIIMGLAWDVVKSKGFLGFGGKSQDIDLDASCIVFDEQGESDGRRMVPTTEVQGWSGRSHWR